MTGTPLETYQSLAEAAPDAIFFVDLETSRIVNINEQTVSLLGYDREELVGTPVTEIHPAEKIEQYEKLFQRASDAETVRFSTLLDGTQVHVVTASGDHVPVEIHAKRVSIEGTPHMFSFVRDVSDQVQRSQRLERMTDELAVLNRLVRHDIRNDMGIVLGWIRQLPDASGDEQRDIIERIEKHGNHIVSLTDIARDYVEVITGDKDVELKPVSLSTVLGDEVAAIRESYPDADIAYTEQTNVDHLVLATPLLESVFHNLLNNAIQHNDSETPHVRVDITENTDTVTVCVADDGPGIPDEQKDTVFGRGEQGLDSSGTGIGLYLVDRLLTQFGGSVRIEDRDPSRFPLPSDSTRSAEDPTGSVFVVSLQAADV